MATGATFTGIVGYWTVPAVRPTANSEYTFTWIGIGGGPGTSRLVQTGTDEFTSGGTTHYAAWYEFIPTSQVGIATAPVSPGNQMEALIKETSTNVWQVEIEDLTNSWRFNHTFSYYAGHQSSAEWITERPQVSTALSTLADFGSTRFTHLKFAGAGLITANESSLCMVGTTGRVIAYSGPVASSTTSSFTDYYGSPLPKVTSVTPSQGATGGGTRVVISGTFLVSGLVESVHFGSALATWSTHSTGTVTAYAPAQTAGTVNVTVTTTDGTSAASSADRFTYVLPAPTISSVSPNTGPTSGGTSVTITGTNLTGTSAVSFGSTPAASFSVTSSTRITATSPAGSGTVDVTVTTPGGTSAVSGADRFTYVLPAPTISSVSPNTGPTSGGSSVTITGTNLKGTSAVSFGSTPAASFGVTSSTRITATSPAGSGTINVTVTTPGGTSAASSADRFIYLAIATGPLTSTVTGVTSTPTGHGYWLVNAQGLVSPHGNAVTYGSMYGKSLNAPISHIVATPDGKGYWLVAADGGTFAFGDAGFYGSMGGKPLNAPVVDIAPTKDGKGYWLVASDGGIFAFGDAGFYGSMGGKPLNAPVVGISPDYATGGYWEVATDGGIFAFTAPFYGSMGGKSLNRPINGMTSTPNDQGYWFVATDGGLFAFGDAGFYGSMGGKPISAPIVGMATDSASGGYWMVGSDGGVYSFRATFFGAH